jgi:hypothetical protein
VAQPRWMDDRSTWPNRLVLAAVLATATVTTVVGCSSSDPAPTAASSSSTSTTSTPPTTQDEEADEALAEDAVLTADEVPGGPWIEGDPRTSSSDPGLDCDEMAEESEYFNENAAGAPGAKAPELTDEATEAELQLDVNIVATDEIADTVAGFFADERFAGCLEQRLLDQASTSSSTTISDAVIEPLDVGSFGDSASAWSVSFTVEQGSQTAEISGVVAFVQVGRGFANVSIVGPTPITADDVEPILEAAADKLEAALG